jgi:hypothetical protein
MTAATYHPEEGENKLLHNQDSFYHFNTALYSENFTVGHTMVHYGTLKKCLFNMEEYFTKYHI